MKVTLTDIIHDPRMDQETPCYTATLVVDGRPIGTLRNDGGGGCTMFSAAGDSSEERTANYQLHRSLQKAYAETHDGWPEFEDYLLTECEIHAGPVMFRVPGDPYEDDDWEMLAQPPAGRDEQIKKIEHRWPGAEIRQTSGYFDLCPI